MVSGFLSRAGLFGVLLLVVAVQCAPESRKPACDCTDVDSRHGDDKHLKWVRRRCWDSYLRGECEKSFMFNTVKELPEGFCRISCGRCDCCSTPRWTASENGLEEWAWAMDAAGLYEWLDGPGFEATILAPRDGALDGLLGRLGWTRGEIESNERMQFALSLILKFNMIAPIPDNFAVYNSVFLNPGMVLPTLFSPNDTVQVQKWDSGGTGFQGPHNSATVQDKDFDKATCKAYINLSDQYLLPFENADHLLEVPGDHGVSKGFCHVARNSVYDGDLVDTIKTDSATECCEACNNRGECNVWVWCARGSGCNVGGNTEHIGWGTCSLKFSKSVAKGGNPDSAERTPITPYHSGHISRSAGESFKTG